jgi:hypothetical protein
VPGYPVAELIGEYKIMLAHLIVLSNKIKQSLL